MGNLKLLHLSDLHIGHFIYNNNVEKLAVKLANYLTDHNAQVDAVVVSGDIFDGRSRDAGADREQALRFFQTLIKQLKEKRLAGSDFCEADLLFVPGNHDLVREDEDQLFHYRAFLESFYPGDLNGYGYVDDGCHFIKVYEQERVILLGLNSCQVQLEELKKNELKWIDRLDLKLPAGAGDSKSIIEQIKQSRIESQVWEDYGEINYIAMDRLFNRIKSIEAAEEYLIVAVFHHHFYPFPEIRQKHGDRSLIRNREEVLTMLQDYRVNFVLHGHKHLSIHQPVIGSRYFDDPENSIIYCLAAGSIGSKDVYQRSFQVLELFKKNDPVIAELRKFDFKAERLEDVKRISFPPASRTGERAVRVELEDILRFRESALYHAYLALFDPYEQIIDDEGIRKILALVSTVLTTSGECKALLEKNAHYVYLILLAIHYRTFQAGGKSGYAGMLCKIGERLEEYYRRNYNQPEFTAKLIEFLEGISFINLQNKDSGQQQYNALIKRVTRDLKKSSSLLVIAVYLTDMFLTLSRYGEFRYKEEGLEAKLNLSLKENRFYQDIPTSTIDITNAVDRRAIRLSYKCKHPTVHKVSVLLLKEYEKSLPQIEESFKEVQLKIYYVIPEVEPQGYELEDYNFNAYIPSLLPLLTGDNLYKQKEVFIRELVQNALDAVLLRRELQPEEPFDSTIRIEWGEVMREGRKQKYFKIIDRGVGMDKFRVERYFTSIGRSFYVSDEFEELVKENNLRFKAISNFGIGFLSAFMVAREIEVVTRGIESPRGLTINIPNYDGCFFVNEVDGIEVGTEITLYEDERRLFDFKKFLKYIKTLFLNLPLDIVVEDKQKKDQIRLEAYWWNKKKYLQNGDHFFYLPFTENGVKELSYYELRKLNGGLFKRHRHGLAFFRGHHKFVFNNGIRLPDETLESMTTDYLSVSVNFPTEYIQLDVAREKIVGVKKAMPRNDVIVNLLGKKMKNVDIWGKLEKQMLEYTSDTDFKKRPFDFIRCYRFLLLNGNRSERLFRSCHSLLINWQEGKLRFQLICNETLENKKNSVLINDDFCSFYFKMLFVYLSILLDAVEHCHQLHPQKAARVSNTDFTIVKENLAFIAERMKEKTLKPTELSLAELLKQLESREQTLRDKVKLMAQMERDLRKQIKPIEKQLKDRVGLTEHRSVFEQIELKLMELMRGREFLRYGEGISLMELMNFSSTDELLSPEEQQEAINRSTRMNLMDRMKVLELLLSSMIEVDHTKIRIFGINTVLQEKLKEYLELVFSFDYNAQLKRYSMLTHFYFFYTQLIRNISLEEALNFKMEIDVDVVY